MTINVESSGERWYTEAIVRIDSTMFPCVSGTALGSEVEPAVNIRRATSSLLTIGTAVSTFEAGAGALTRDMLTDEASPEPFTLMTHGMGQPGQEPGSSSFSAWVC